MQPVCRTLKECKTQTQFMELTVKIRRKLLSLRLACVCVWMLRFFFSLVAAGLFLDQQEAASDRWLHFVFIWLCKHEISLFLLHGLPNNRAAQQVIREQHVTSPTNTHTGWRTAAGFYLLSKHLNQHFILHRSTVLAFVKLLNILFILSKGCVRYLPAYL